MFRLSQPTDLVTRLTERPWAPRVWSLLLTISLCTGVTFYVTGCDDESAEGNEPNQMSSQDMYQPIVDELDAQTESDSGRSVSESLKAFGESCASQSECVSGLCIVNDDEGVCTDTCLGETCPQGWGCVASAGTGPDVQYLCSPIRARLCRGCANDSDCPAGQCVNLDGLSVCAQDCEEDVDCPGSYVCALIDTLGTRQCLPRSGSCTCNPTTAGDQRVCERENEEGVCYGRQTCDPDRGWSSCDASTPAPETCNLIDDDCNGITDDVPLLGAECQNEAALSDPSGDLETFVCTGRVICDPNQPEPLCTAQTPAHELCNYIDDDCDGSTDERFDRLGEVCTVGEGTCARYGVYECSDDALSAQCSVSPGTSTPEICDGLDNDCDGQLDEGFDDIGLACEVGIGLCRRVGVNRCAEGGAEVICSAQAAAPLLEICDGFDNDCDGQLDEGFIGLNEVCMVGVGFCQQVGFMSCSEDGQEVVCGVSAAEAASLARPELCDLIDNDCDAKVDEDFPQLNSICQVGRGACERRGVSICGANQTEVVCSVEPGLPTDELCDQIDNDCDGAIDELWPSLGDACLAGQGQCQRAGIIVCGDDQESARCNAIQVEGNPQDLCDYLDDDCDGHVDEESRDADGHYSSLTHCGACDLNCASLWGEEDPADLGISLTCEAQDGDQFRCGYQCLNGYIDADGRADNGCELREDLGVIYVAPAEYGGTSSGGCGSVNEPCFTITHGINRARLDGKSRVLVSEGTYREMIDLVDGISVLGGHDRTSWVRDPEIFVSQLDARGLEHSDAHAYGVRGVGIREETMLSGFTLYGGSALNGGNAYGVYLMDCNQNLTISHMRIIAGDGGRGVDGDSGASGSDGIDGGSGVQSRTIVNPTLCGDDPIFGFAGLVGGASTPQMCEGVSTRGGGGGYSGCPVFAEYNTPGAGGDGVTGGFGGSGATHFQSTNPGICTVSSGGSVVATPDARSGAPGRSGDDGLGGSTRGVAQGRIVLGHWRAYQGESGETGSAGGGGGGGGAAAGVVISWSPDTSDFGASGGSGGNGGCPGARGNGGAGGGGSFGIFVTYLSILPADINALPLLSHNIISRGYGGVGGHGGNGGGGGAGGSGGTGGMTGEVLLPNCSLQAGDGGSGGRGGHGGGGAGGNGGVSFDIALSGASLSAPSRYRSENTFMIRSDQNTGGAGGVGGNSSNTTIGRGGQGIDGLSGQLGEL